MSKPVVPPAEEKPAEQPAQPEEFSLENTLNARLRVAVPAEPKGRAPYVRDRTEPSLPLPTTAELRQLSDRIRAEREAAESKADNKEAGSKPAK